MEMQNTRITKTILIKNKVGRFSFLSFKTNYKATVIKKVWYCIRQIHTNRTEVRIQEKKKTYIYGYVIVEKCANVIHYRKEQL